MVPSDISSFILPSQGNHSSCRVHFIQKHVCFPAILILCVCSHNQVMASLYMFSTCMANLLSLSHYFCEGCPR